MTERILVTFLVVLLPAVAASQESGKYQCTYGDMQRRVEIAHEPGVEVPCSVHYFKDTEMPGEQQVLWSAENDPTYCRDRARELVAKLEGWGWDCGQGSAEAMDEAAEAPDTADPEEMLGEPDADEMAEPEEGTADDASTG